MDRFTDWRRDWRRGGDPAHPQLGPLGGWPHPVPGRSSPPALLRDCGNLVGVSACSLVLRALDALKRTSYLERAKRGE